MQKRYLGAPRRQTRSVDHLSMNISAKDVEIRTAKNCIMVYGDVLLKLVARDSLLLDSLARECDVDDVDADTDFL